MAAAESANPLVDLTAQDKDEFIVDVDKVELIADFQDKLYKLFEVTFTFGDSVEEQDLGRKQWVEVEGNTLDRKRAKEYILALCHPAVTQKVDFPKELTDLLSDQHIQQRVEKQSKAVLLLAKPGTINIHGNDDISVTLALSAIEDLISRHVEVEAENHESSFSAQFGGSRLNEELRRRLSTENGEVVDEEELTNMNSAIKRTLLGVLLAEKDVSPAASLEDYGIKPHNVTGASPATKKQALSSSPQKPVRKTKDQRSCSLGEAAKHLNKIHIQPENQSSTSSNNSDNFEDWKAFAVEQGFSTEQIQQVFDKYGKNLKFSEFFQYLNGMEKSAQPEEVKTSKQVAVYIDRLSRDHIEETNVDNIDELLSRNVERQRLLIDIFNKRKAQQGKDAEAELETANKEDNVDAPLTQHTQRANHTDQQGNRRWDVPENQPSATVTQPNQTTQQQKYPQNFVLPTQAQGMQEPLRPIPQVENNPAVARTRAEKPRHRYIIIDGSNVAMEHGNHEVFSCMGIQVCVNYFLARGHTEITAFVPHTRTHAPHPDRPINDQHILHDLKKKGYLVFTPARRIPGKSIVCYDDRYVIRLAEETDGVIVSNDNYRDLYHEKREWQNVISNSLLMFSFIRGKFWLPDDPLGKDGPLLDEFLTIGGHIYSNLHQRDSRPGGYHQPHQQQNFMPRSSYPNTRYQQPHQQQQYQSNPYNKPQQTRPWTQKQPSSSATGSNPNQRHRQPRPTFSNPPNPRQPRQQSGPRFQQGRPEPSFRGSDQQRPRNSVPVSATAGLDAIDSGWHHVPVRNPQNREGTSDMSSQRHPDTTAQLLESLMAVFPDKESVIHKVLQENPNETDVNTLSVHVLSFL